MGSQKKIFSFSVVSLPDFILIRIFNTLQVCQLAVQAKQTVRLLQITDTHLFANSDECLLGVNTAQSFQAVISEILHTRVEFDGIIATGDISQDHSSASYQTFLNGIRQWSLPCYWLPGNHDEQNEMHAILSQSPLVRADVVLLGEHWQMIMLDSQVKGSPHGWLDDKQIHLLQDIVDANPSRHTLIAFHHHPIPVASAWLDQHILKNREAFWEEVKDMKQVKAVICGHIHQTLDIECFGKRVLAAPSTCIQFLPNSDQFSLDLVSPGWREISLHADGAITTTVKRIKGNQFIPDMNSSGY